MTEKESRLKLALAADEEYLRLKQKLAEAIRENSDRRAANKKKIRPHEAWIRKALGVVRNIKIAVSRRRRIIYLIKWDYGTGGSRKPRKVRNVEAQLNNRAGVIRRKLYRLISLEAIEEARRLWAEEDKL